MWFGLAAGGVGGSVGWRCNWPQLHCIGFIVSLPLKRSSGGSRDQESQEREHGWRVLTEKRSVISVANINERQYCTASLCVCLLVTPGSSQVTGNNTGTNIKLMPVLWLWYCSLFFYSTTGTVIGGVPNSQEPYKTQWIQFFEGAVFTAAKYWEKLPSVSGNESINQKINRWSWLGTQLQVVTSPGEDNRTQVAPVDVSMLEEWLDIPDGQVDPCIVVPVITVWIMTCITKALWVVGRPSTISLRSTSSKCLLFCFCFTMI